MEEDTNNLSLDMDMFIDIPEEDTSFVLEEDEDEEIESPQDNPDEDLNEDPEKVVEEESSKKEENDDDDEEKGDEPDSSSNPNLFKSLTELLHQKSLLSSLDSDVETEDDFVNVFTKELDTQIDKLLVERFGEENAHFVKQGVPLEKVQKNNEEFKQLESITNETISSDPELQKRILYQDFINRGYDEQKAVKYVNRSLELDAGEEDALEAIESIRERQTERVNLENQKILEQKTAQDKAREDNIKLITKEIDNMTEVISDFPVSKNVKAKVKEAMFNVVGSNPDTGESENTLMKYRRENPVEFDKKLYYLFTVTNNFENFDLLNSSSKSKAIKDLEKAFHSTTAIKDPGAPSYLQDPNSYEIDLKGDEIPSEY
tara:strand:- start:5535 stop:6656 length:1122 start_codon:yes stop_codon:yes gene_type:complete